MTDKFKVGDIIENIRDGEKFEVIKIDKNKNDNDDDWVNEHIYVKVLTPLYTFISPKYYKLAEVKNV